MSPWNSEFTRQHYCGTRHDIQFLSDLLYNHHWAYNVVVKPVWVLRATTLPPTPTPVLRGLLVCLDLIQPPWSSCTEPEAVDRRSTSTLHISLEFVDSIQIITISLINFKYMTDWLYDYNIVGRGKASAATLFRVRSRANKHGYCLSAQQIWDSRFHFWPRYSQKPKFKVATAAILNFGKSVIVGINCTANVDLQTKFGDQSRNGWDTFAYVFPRWRPSAILDMPFLFFGPYTSPA